MKNRAATNKKHTIDSQMPKRRENKHEIKGNYQTTKRKRNKRRNKENLHPRILYPVRLSFIIGEISNFTDEQKLKNTALLNLSKKKYQKVFSI